MQFNQQINMGRLLTTSVISALVLVVLILGMQAWFQSAEATQAEAANGMAQSEFADLKTQQLANLKQVAWSSDKKVAATMPIDTAMAILVKANGKMPSTQP